MFGLILTYALLIYQTRDSKADLEKVVKTEMFMSKNEELQAQLLEIMKVIRKNPTGT